MRDLPALSAAAIRTVLAAHYGLATATLTFLPVGNDAASFVYRAEGADGRRYFLKVRASGGFSPASLLVPRALHDRGIPHIAAPLPTPGGALWVALGDFALSLAPFLDARTARAAGLSLAQWEALGATLRQIHTADLPTDIYQQIPRERFVPSRRDLLPRIAALVAADPGSDPLLHDLGRLWRERAAQIAALTDSADRLGAALRGAGRPPVLCHADLHSWNILLDSDQQMWIVDWDEVVLAPKERDLMFVVGGIGRGLVSANESAAFLRGYGDPAIDKQTLAYYRAAWAVQDIAAYAEICIAPDRSAESRRDALAGLTDVFAPGNIADIASAPAGDACSLEQ